MCGIFALFNDNQNSNVIEASNESKWRGPDSSHYKNYSNLDLYLSFHRLAINGLDSNSSQPFEINNKILICNGEIYNYKKLYLELKVEPKTKSDCEVIIYLYEKYGIEYTLNLLDGVFAFILIDINKNIAFAARDPYGVRPMFILTTENSQYGFASELKQLHNIYSISDIKQVVPGCYYRLDLNKFWDLHSLNRYNCFTLTKFGELSSLYDEEQNLSLIRNLFINAVKKRVETTERPIACLLSGGLDSSIVASLVSRFSENQIETYSIGLKNSEDLKYARIVAEALETNHTEIVVDESDFFAATEEVIYAIESYDTTTVRASIGNYLVADYISKNSKAKVIFNGDGSDELMGGYLYMNKAPDCLEFDKECKRLLKNIHYFDVLRSDRSISTRGLEPRTPFLDREFTNYYLSIPANYRFETNKNIEKYLFRKAFEGYLPDEILWRKKEAFSDGVSGHDKSWFEIITEFVDKLEFSNKNFINNNPVSKEQKYYRNIFEKYYGNRGDIIPYFWMPKYVDAKDPSARTLKL